MRYARGQPSDNYNYLQTFVLQKVQQIRTLCLTTFHQNGWNVTKYIIGKYNNFSCQRLWCRYFLEKGGTWFKCVLAPPCGRHWWKFSSKDRTADNCYRLECSPFSWTLLLNFTYHSNLKKQINPYLVQHQEVVIPRRTFSWNNARKKTTEHWQEASCCWWGWWGS